MQGRRGSESAQENETPADCEAREYVLGQYLRQEITREQAIEAVGLDWVELAERQHSAMFEDLTWAANA